MTVRRMGEQGRTVATETRTETDVLYMQGGSMATGGGRFVPAESQRPWEWWGLWDRAGLRLLGPARSP